MQTVFTHLQVPFLLSTGETTSVDAGLFNLLCLLRELGVETDYSCQHNLDSAYVCGTALSFYPIILGLMSIQHDYKILMDIFNRRGVNTYEMSTDLEHGMRFTIRWDPDATEQFCDALRELVKSDQSYSTN